MIRRPPRSTQSRSSAASDVYKRQFMSKIIFFYVFAINLLMLISTFIENKYAVGDSLAAYYIYTSHDKANKIYNGLLE